MDKAKQEELVKQALSEIPYLRGLHYSNGEFKAWNNKVSRMLESAYGSESKEYRRFVNATGKHFVIRTETGLEHEYNWQLECYEDVLKSLVSSK